MSAQDAQAHFVQFTAIAHLYTSSKANRRSHAGVSARARRKRRPAAPERDEKNFSRSAARAPISTRFAQNCATLRGRERRASATQPRSTHTSSRRKNDPDRHPFLISSCARTTRFRTPEFFAEHDGGDKSVPARRSTTSCAGRDSSGAASPKNTRVSARPLQRSSRTLRSLCACRCWGTEHRIRDRRRSNRRCSRSSRGCRARARGARATPDCRSSPRQDGNCLTGVRCAARRLPRAERAGFANGDKGESESGETRGEG